MAVQPPAPRPCASCPYRQDAPSGVWDESEYGKLPQYDEPTMRQPPGIFLCHQNDHDDTRSRVCAGWAGCHDGPHLLALRFGLVSGLITPETADAVCDYVSPVPLFASGREAAEHGMREMDAPGREARDAIHKIERRRSDLR